MRESQKTILVLGGTGHYGRHAVFSLKQKGVQVRVLTRDPIKARMILGDQVEIIGGDITSTDSLAAAVHGVDGMIVSISAFSPRQIRRLKEIEQDAVLSAFEEARQAGVKRVVYISVFEVYQDTATRFRLPISNVKAAVEQSLARFDFNWTILGAPPSMEIFFAMIRGNAMMVPGGGPSGLPSVSPVDAGEIAAQAVLRDDLAGRRFKMVGPEAISFPDAARRISRVWGRSITFRKIPLIFPLIAYYLTSPLTPFSNRLYFVHTMLGFVRLLNQFPQTQVAEVPKLHRELLSIFDYTPTTLEMEAARRKES
jgi:uncharacterized protein YbjT (DUF2867 family)